MARFASRLLSSAILQLRRSRGTLPRCASSDIASPAHAYAYARHDNGRPRFRFFGPDDGGARTINSSSLDSSPLAAPTSPAAPVSIAAHTVRQRESAREACPQLVLDTNNGEQLYAGMTSGELLSTFATLNLVASEKLVDLSIKILRSPVARAFPVENMCNWVVKRTTYRHFCAGENVQEAALVLKRLWELGLRGVLDNSMEDAETNSECDSNLAGFLQALSQTDDLPVGSLSASVAKVTALAPLPLLERLSDLLRWRHMHPDFQLPWDETGLPLLAPESPTFHVRTPPRALDAEEEKHVSAAHERLWKLVEACQQRGLPILFDAEYSDVQPAIDYLALNAALRFNRPGSPQVYATFQAYLKDALPRLSLAAEAFSNRGVPLGVKLVRGAYLSRENALAAARSAESPVHSSIQDTHRCYDQCVAYVLERATSGEAYIVVATHNVESGKAAACKAEELGIARRDGRLHFAQLKGMANGLSLALANAGFRVSKYLPFGPVHQVLPYLIRRAEENRGVIGNTRDERDSIRKELKRRLRTALRVS